MDPSGYNGTYADPSMTNGTYTDPSVSNSTYMDTPMLMNSTFTDPSMTMNSTFTDASMPMNSTFTDASMPIISTFTDASAMGSTFTDASMPLNSTFTDASAASSNATYSDPALQSNGTYMDPSNSSYMDPSMMTNVSASLVPAELPLGAPYTPPVAFGEWGYTSILTLWVPAVVFAHVFAAFWLWQAWRLHSPSSAASCRKAKAAAGGLGRGRNGAGRGAEPAAPADLEGQPDLESATADAVAARDDEEQVLKTLESAAKTTVLTGLHTSSDQQGTLLSVPPTLEWRGIGCTYNTAAGPKKVLTDVWGAARPGEMQALLGPSGAGKSTLMDILALRKTLGRLSGLMLVDGVRADRGFVRKAAYVPQDDNFVPTMTTWETLNFYARILLPRSEWSSQRRDARIDEVLAEVGLLHARNTVVGGTLPGGLMVRGLSGGERKRLSVAASGILAAPAFLFLDEPTSGLDSFAALTVMGYLKRLARERGRVVIASIHQPRSAIWTMFDAVTLLASGHLMFHGRRDGMTEWFGSLGYNYNPDISGVPSDWALDLVAIGFPKPAHYYGSTITNMEELSYAAAAFKSRYLIDMELEDAEAGTEQSGSPNCNGDAAAPSETALEAAPAPKGAAAAGRATGAWHQYKTLLWRELLSITRNPFDVAGRTLTFAWVGLFMGALTYGTAPDASSLQNRLSLLQMMLCFYLLMPYVSIGLYAADKKFVCADAASQLYRPLAYYLAKVTAVTPFQLITACVYGFTVYGMAGLRPGAEHVAKNAVVCVLLHLIATQVLHCSAVAAPNQDTAFMISITWTAVQMLLSGVFVDFRGVWLYGLTYLRYLSALFYAFQAAANNEFGGLVLPCTGKGVTQGSVGEWIGRALPDTSNAQRRQLELLFEGHARRECTFDPSDTLQYFQLNGSGYNSQIGVLVGYLLGMHLLTYVTMRITTRREMR